MSKLFPVTVASVNGLMVKTSQGYTLTRIGNKSLRKGDTIYTDGKYVYGMEGSGGKQLPILPSVNYLFFNPYGIDGKNPGIYGFYRTFSKPVFVCKSPYRPIFIGVNNAYQEPLEYGTCDVVEISSGKEITNTYSDDYNVWTTGIDRPGLDQCVSSNGDYMEIRAGQVKQTVTNEPFGTQFTQSLGAAILFKNGEVVDSPVLAKWYGNNNDDCSPFMAHINDDGSYQCLCHGNLDRSFWEINKNGDYCDMDEDTWGEDFVESKKVKFPPTPPVGANFYESKDDGKFHLYKRDKSGTKEVFASASIDAICAYKDSSGRVPFADAYFALEEFKRYGEEILWKYDSSTGKREKISYTVTERRFYQCVPRSDEPVEDGTVKSYILSLKDDKVYRNGAYVQTYTSTALYDNKETGLFERYWFCTEPYDSYPLKRDETYNYRYRYSSKPVDIQIGTDLSGKPIMMTYLEDNSVQPLSKRTYSCCGYTSKSPIKHAVHLGGSRYVLLIGSYVESSGIMVVNSATGEHRKAFNGGLGYYNTRLTKSSRNLINTIKKVLPEKAGD